MKKSSDKQANPAGYPEIENMSAVELADALELALDSTTEVNEALVDAYLHALRQKAPIPDVPDVETAFADFQKRRRQLAPVCTRRLAWAGTAVFAAAFILGAIAGLRFKDKPKIFLPIDKHI